MSSMQLPPIDANAGVHASVGPEKPRARSNASAPSPHKLPEADKKGIFSSIKTSFSTHVAKPIRDMFSKEISFPDNVTKQKFSLTKGIKESLAIADHTLASNPFTAVPLRVLLLPVILIRLAILEYRNAEEKKQTENENNSFVKF